MTGIGAALAAGGLGLTAAGSKGDLRADYAKTGVSLREGSPADAGFAFPAEWAPHERTVMQFLPAQNWPARQVGPAREEWALVANTVAGFEPVTMAVDPKDLAEARRLLTGEIELVEAPMNDGWSRDSGPMVLVNGDGERAVAGFTFNGWGEKFPPYDEDAQLKARLAKHFDLPFYPAPLVLEGGAVALDGEGTCLTTEECLLHPNRNPGLDKAAVEAVLRDWLGVSRVIWLGRGLTPDPITDGHVDGFAAFAAPGVVLLHSLDYPADPNHAILQEAKRRLAEARDAKGRTLEVIELPLARDVVHMNFYLCNGGVVVPTVGDAAQDDPALAVLREVFPDRRVVGVSGEMLSYGGGGVHCITQQMPLAA